MICTGTVINTVGILIGGCLGHFTGKLFNLTQQDAISKACGVSVLFIGTAGAMEGMLAISGDGLKSGGAMLVVLSIVIGSIIGELIGIEDHFESFGNYLKKKSGNEGDDKFISAFVTASLTVCIGAMAIVGAIQDGISGDYYILAVKTVLDFIIVAIMTSSMGKGCIFSAVPVFLFEGGITLLAKGIAPVMTELATAYLSLVGSILIFCVGLNLLREEKLRVANMLPAVVVAVTAAYV